MGPNNKAIILKLFFIKHSTGPPPRLEITLLDQGLVGGSLMMSSPPEGLCCILTLAGQLLLDYIIKLM